MKKLVLSLLTAIMATSAAYADPIVDIKTTFGDIKVKLYDDTPIHRDNFLKLVREGYYDGVLFHRVIKDFMVQAGDPDSKTADSTAMLGSGDPSYTLEAEINYPKHFHKYGALAAARTGDNVNPERRSSGSQFYIVTGKKVDPKTLEMMETRANNERKQQYFNRLSKEHMDEIRQLISENKRAELDSLRDSLVNLTETNVKFEPIPEDIKKAYVEQGGTPHLDGAYTVFGEVVQGMEVVEKIEQEETDPRDRPKRDVRIISMKVEE